MLGFRAVSRMDRGPQWIKADQIWNGVANGGAAFFRDLQSAFLSRAAILVNLRGRDVEGFVKEALAGLKADVKFPPGYYFEFGGQFENLIVFLCQRLLGISVQGFAKGPDGGKRMGWLELQCNARGSGPAYADYLPGRPLAGAVSIRAAGAAWPRRGLTPQRPARLPASISASAEISSSTWCFSPPSGSCSHSGLALAAIRARPSALARSQSSRATSTSMRAWPSDSLRCRTVAETRPPW